MIDAKQSPPEAQAFVVFSALFAPLQLAQSLGAGIPGSFAVDYPYDLGPSPASLRPDRKDMLINRSQPFCFRRQRSITSMP